MVATAGPRGANALKEGQEIVVRVEVACRAPAEVVYDLVSNVRTHLEWNGNKPNKKFGLLSIDGPEGPATVGTRWTSRGIDPAGRTLDRSEVTAADRPRVFEFATEAHFDMKGGKSSDWTLVNRYEITPQGSGCRVALISRAVRISALPGSMRLLTLPVFRSLAPKVSAAYGKPHLKNLVAMAEERAGIRPAG